MKILIVDDEQTLLDQLKTALEDQRYLVETAIDGEQVLTKLFDNPVDLIILDIMLPKRDGLSVLGDIRQAGLTTPVLMLTARGDIDDKIMGLDLGADDYLAKPFSLDELLARIRALLRRSGGQTDSVLRAQDLQLDTVSREVSQGGSGGGIDRPGILHPGISAVQQEPGRIPLQSGRARLGGRLRSLQHVQFHGCSYQEPAEKNRRLGTRAQSSGPFVAWVTS